MLLLLSAACPGDYEISSGDGPLPMAIFELLEYIVNEVSSCHCPSLIHNDDYNNDAIVISVCGTFLVRPGRDAEYCNQPVCLCIRPSVCLSVCEHISGTAGPMVSKYCLQIHCGHGSVLLRQRCAMLCTSSFMDDVTFGRNGHDAERWSSAGDQLRA